MVTHWSFIKLHTFPGSLPVLTFIFFLDHSLFSPPFFFSSPFFNCRLFLRLGIYTHTPTTSKQALPTSVFLLLLYVFICFILVLSHFSFWVFIPPFPLQTHPSHTPPLTVPLLHMQRLFCVCLARNSQMSNSNGSSHLPYPNSAGASVASLAIFPSWDPDGGSEAMSASFSDALNTSGLSLTVETAKAAGREKEWTWGAAFAL